MAFWNRKKKQELAPPQCRHHWKDFPWYYEATYYRDTSTLNFKVIEPYVCIHCKERKNIELFHRSSYYRDRDKADKYVTEFLEEHKDKFQARVITEDQIADMQLVDREYLEIYAMCLCRLQFQ